MRWAARTKPYLDLPRPMILAHQGASGHAPSNTLEAIALGIEMGADALETDVHMTRDGYVVTSHDDTIDRLTNGTGLIKNKTLAELREFDYGYEFTPDGGATYPYRGQGVTLPTLADVLEQFPTLRVNIDIKQVNPPLEMALHETIRQYQAEDRVLVTSFHSETMKRFRRIASSRIATSANTMDMIKFVCYWRMGVHRLYKPSVDAFQVPESGYGVRVVTPRMIEIAHEHGVKVHVWTINEEADIRRLLEWGVDGICSDYPDRVVKVMREMGKL